MKHEIVDLLWNDYPKIFSGKAYPECGDGWYDLIDSLCHTIQNNIDLHKTEQFVCTQIKEKFGGIRFYGGPADGEIYDIIDFAEAHSFKVCERCGNRGELRGGSGWLYTSCAEHAREEVR